MPEVAGLLRDLQGKKSVREGKDFLTFQLLFRKFDRVSVGSTRGPALELSLHTQGGGGFDDPVSLFLEHDGGAIKVSGKRRIPGYHENYEHGELGRLDEVTAVRDFYALKDLMLRHELSQKPWRELEF
jgi:hypothetical protein